MYNSSLIFNDCGTWPYSSIGELEVNNFQSDSNNVIFEQLNESDQPAIELAIAQNKNVKLLLSMAHELELTHIDKIVVKLKSRLERCKHLVNNTSLTDSDVYVMLNSFSENTGKQREDILAYGFNIVYIDYFNWFVHKICPDNKQLYKRNNTNLGLYLPGKMHRYDRIRLAAMLYKHQALEHLTWAFRMPNVAMKDLSILSVRDLCYNHVADLFTKREYKTFLTLMTKELDNPMLTMKDGHYQCTSFPYDVSIFQDTKFSLVCETKTPNWITEKTYKAIAHKHPFIICSDQPILHTLTGLGFKTFEEHLPIKYDHLCINDKLEAIVNNVQWMATHDISLMQADAEHNYKLFRSRGHVAQQQVDAILNNFFEVG